MAQRSEPTVRQPRGRAARRRSRARSAQAVGAGWLLVAAWGGALGLRAATGCAGGTPTGAPPSEETALPEAPPTGSSEPEAPPEEQQVATEPDPKALDELLQAVPSGRPPSTGPDGGTLVGTDTELPRDAGRRRDAPAPGTDSAPHGVLRAGAIEIQPGPSNAAIESALRAQIYWPLVQQCRDADGDLLPPEAVTLTFTIRIDGTVDPGSVGASASERRFEEAADCMVRAFSAIAFRGPPSSVGQSSRVVATIPSVD